MKYEYHEGPEMSEKFEKMAARGFRALSLARKPLITERVATGLLGQYREPILAAHGIEKRDSKSDLGECPLNTA